MNLKFSQILTMKKPSEAPVKPAGYMFNSDVKSDTSDDKLKIQKRMSRDDLLQHSRESKKESHTDSIVPGAKSPEIDDEKPDKIFGDLTKNMRGVNLPKFKNSFISPKGHIQSSKIDINLGQIEMKMGTILDPESTH